MAVSLGGGDAQDQVDHQTKVVFTYFVNEKLETDNLGHIDNPTEVTGLDPMQNRNLAQIGRQLARIGDDVNERFKQQFEQIANQLDISNDTIYEKFSKIVQSMLRQEANWGRILTLFCFGYYLVRHFLGNSSLAEAFNRIQECVIHFVRNYIAQWIISQGGWLQVAAENMTNDENRSMYKLAAVGGGIVAVLCAIYFLRKKN